MVKKMVDRSMSTIRFDIIELNLTVAQAATTNIIKSVKMMIAILYLEITQSNFSNHNSANF